MPTFRKLPVTIEARQFIHHGDERLVVKFAIIDWIRTNGGTAHPQDDGIRIATLEGDHLASHGDWIIRGVKGEFYPCKPDIFAATYEEVPAPRIADKASPIMRFFKYDHLPAKLQTVSRPLGQLAERMDAEIPDGAEKSAGLRKLLEAKDCLVRAALPV